MIVFEIPGNPVAWARARSNGKRFFVDAKTAAFKEDVAIRARIATQGRPPSTQPVRLDITATFGVPKSWNRRDTAAALAGERAPTSKPDWDNLGKAVSDALNGVAYVDDAQVVDGTVSKRYGLVPSMRVRVSER